MEKTLRDNSKVIFQIFITPYYTCHTIMLNPKAILPIPSAVEHPLYNYLPYKSDYVWSGIQCSWNITHSVWNCGVTPLNYRNVEDGT